MDIWKTGRRSLFLRLFLITALTFSTITLIAENTRAAVTNVGIVSPTQLLPTTATQGCALPINIEVTGTPDDDYNLDVTVSSPDGTTQSTATSSGTIPTTGTTTITVMYPAYFPNVGTSQTGHYDIAVTETTSSITASEQDAILVTGANILNPSQDILIQGDSTSLTIQVGHESTYSWSLLTTVTDPGGTPHSTTITGGPGSGSGQVTYPDDFTDGDTASTGAYMVEASVTIDPGGPNEELIEAEHREFVVREDLSQVKDNPHMGASMFSSTPDECAACHRAHTAQASNLLKTGPTMEQFCYSCHENGSGAYTDVANGIYFGTLQGVQDEGLRGGGFKHVKMDPAITGIPYVASATSWHTVDSTAGTMWGSGPIDSGPGYTPVTMECTNCHNPHGNSNYRILRSQPLEGYNSDGPDGIPNTHDVNVIPAQTNDYTIDYLTSSHRDSTYVPENLGEWCVQCHTRYMAAVGAGHTDSGDDTYHYRHNTQGTFLSCVACHVSHGTSATMDQYSSAVPWPDGTRTTSDSERSSLLHSNNRGVCARCHINQDGKVYMHGGGAGSGCESCHGHSDGYNGQSYYGTTQSHATHTEDMLKGPNPSLQCIDCHDTDNYPTFNDGQGKADTNVCDECHSVGGVGGGSDEAKGYWSSGAYSSPTLQVGKDRWCITCHDDDPALINGVNAPNIAGDDTTYGYFVTGHGKSEWNKKCTDCHDSELAHIDGVQPTYDGVVDSYNNGYRLSQSGGYAMQYPRATGSFSADDFRLCFSCHYELDVLGVPDDYAYWQGFAEPSDYSQTLPAGSTPPTNFRNDETWGFYYGSAGGFTNVHWDHIVGMSTFDCVDTTFSGSFDSAMSCVSCHNPHGTKDSTGNPTAQMTRGDLDISFGQYSAGSGNYGYGYIGSNDYNDSTPDLSCWACHSSGAGTDPGPGTRYYRLPWITPTVVNSTGFGDTDNMNDDSISTGSTLDAGTTELILDLGGDQEVTEVRIHASSSVSSQWDVYVSDASTGPWTSVKTSWLVGGDSSPTNHWYSTTLTEEQGAYLKIEGQRLDGSDTDEAVFEFDFLAGTLWYTSDSIYSADDAWSSTWQTPESIYSSGTEVAYADLLIDSHEDGGLSGITLGWNSPSSHDALNTTGISAPENLYDDAFDISERYASTGSTFQSDSPEVVFDLGGSHTVSDIRMYARGTDHHDPSTPGGGIHSSSGFGTDSSLVDANTSTGSTLDDGNVWAVFDLGNSRMVYNYGLYAGANIESDWDVYVSDDTGNWGIPVLEDWSAGYENDPGWYYAGDRGTNLITPKVGRYVKIEGQRITGSSSDVALFEFEVKVDDSWSIWDVYVSDSTSDWGTPVLEDWSLGGTFSDQWHGTLLTTFKSGQYIKLAGKGVATETSIFEFDFRDASTTGPYEAIYDLGQQYDINNVALCTSPQVESDWTVSATNDPIGGPWNDIVTGWHIEPDLYIDTPDDEWNVASTTMTVSTQAARYLRIEGAQDITTAVYTGTHTGGDDPFSLLDGNRLPADFWTATELINMVVFNETDGSWGVITAGYENRLSAILRGGIDNDWDSGDQYKITTGAWNVVASELAFTFHDTTKLTDGDIGTGNGLYNINAPNELVLDLGGDHNIDVLRIFANSGVSTRWHVDVAEDDSGIPGTWTRMITDWDISSSQPQWETHDISPPTPVRYIRLTTERLTAASQPPSDFHIATEFQFHDTSP
ncbi:MAG: cytochrome c3 family protein [Chloroflexota bacterium]|nr:cytochrome c3 family protein [Chloroflexota bacterium]